VSGGSSCTRRISSAHEDEETYECGRLATVEALTTAGQWEPHCGVHVQGWPSDRVRTVRVAEADDGDGVDWAEVAWDDRELSGDVGCCDSRDHSNGSDDDVQCPCPNHPRSYLHPAGEREWPTP
jgi:hypothetical protein